MREREGASFLGATIFGQALQRVGALVSLLGGPVGAGPVQSFGDAPLEPNRGDEPDATREQRRRIIRSLVMATSALADAYTEAADASLSPSPPGDPA